MKCIKTKMASVNKVVRLIAVLILLGGVAVPPPAIFAQSTSKKVTGVITDDATGDPLIGATVQVKGVAIGATSDLNGYFTINLPAGKNVLLFSYVGYNTKEVTVGKELDLRVSLQEEANKLDDVVVVGYGQQKKGHLVSSIQVVNPSDLKMPSSSLSTGFAGRLAGVIAVQRNGQPGADQADFWIRGISTFGTATKPLIILDGVAIDANELNGLDPEIIESFSVLKDATATALYGSRGANGVMIVTTKNGKNLDKPVVNFRFETAFSSPTSRPKTADAVTYMQMYNEAASTRGTGQIPYSQDKINGTIAKGDPYLYPNVDWYDKMFKNLALNENLNFNIRGGGSKVDYFMSATVRHEEGMMKSLSRDYFSYDNNYSVWRYAFQNNINVNLTQSTKVTLKINTQLRDTHGPAKSSEDIFGMIMNGNPSDMPIAYPTDPSVNHIQWGGKQLVKNPVAEMVTGYKDEFQSVLNANLSLDQQFDFITKGLSASALMSFKNYSYTQTTRKAGYNTYEAVGSSVDANGNTIYDLNRVGNEQSTTLATSNGTDGDRKIYFQAMLNYNRSFGRHDVSAMAVYNQEGTSLSNPTTLFKSLPKRKQGIAGRLTYSYDNRYLIEGNFGYNGSENFAKGKRFGFFPSVAVGYVVSQEKYWESLKNVVSYFKLRGSYGLVGNDSEDTRFMYMSDLSLTGDESQYTTGADGSYTASGPVYRRFENNNITWETGKKLNVGVDFQFFNRLNVMVDGFQEVRDGIFLERGTIPAFLGTAGTKVYGNLGKVRNRGVDLSMDYTHQVNKDLVITAKGTFTFARNIVLEQDESDYQQYPNLSRVGHSINSFLLYQAQRLFIDDNEVKYSPTQTLGGVVMAGDIKYVNQPDVNGNYDNTINDNDQIYAGYPEVPEIVYGFGLSAQWKGFDFSVFFQGAAHTSLVMKGFHPFGNLDKRNVMQFVADDYWSEQNQNIYAAYPRLSILEYGNNTVASTYWLRDASFLKLKNAEIGYTYKKMRVYVSGTNLLTFSKFKLWDPEQGGGSGLKYPTQRVINIGIQITL